MTMDPSALLGFSLGGFVVALVLQVLHLWNGEHYVGRLANAAQLGVTALWMAGCAWELSAPGTWLAINARQLCLLLGGTISLMGLFVAWRFSVRPAVLGILFVLALGTYALLVLPPIRLGAIPTRMGVWYLIYATFSILSSSLVINLACIGLLTVMAPLIEQKTARTLRPMVASLNVAWVELLGWTVIAWTATLAARGWHSWLMTGSFWQWSSAELWQLSMWSSAAALWHFEPGRVPGLLSAMALLLLGFASASLV